MSAKSNWKMTLYKANVDTASTTPYAKTLITTVTAYAGAASLSMFITRSGKIFEGATAKLIDISGSATGTNRSKLFFDVELWPMSFNATTEPDIDDLEVMRNFLHRARWLWVRFDAGSRMQPSATEVYPVIVNEVNEAVNADEGMHTLTMKIEHRYEMAVY